MSPCAFCPSIVATSPADFINYVSCCMHISRMLFVCKRWGIASYRTWRSRDIDGGVVPLIMEGALPSFSISTSFALLYLLRRLLLGILIGWW